MATAICFYHSERQAIDKCKRCNRLICLKDKIKKDYTKNMGTAENRDYINYQGILCPLCNLNQELNIRRNIKNPVGLIVIGIFILFIFIMGSTLLMVGVMILSSALNILQPISVQSQPEPDYIMALFSLPFILGGIIIGLIVPFVLIISEIKVLRENPTKVEELLSQKKLFIDSITSSKAKKQLAMVELTDKSISCFQCGAKIYPNDQFCSNCGDTTKDEFSSVSC